MSHDRCTTRTDKVIRELFSFPLLLLFCSSQFIIDEAGLALPWRSSVRFLQNHTLPFFLFPPLLPNPCKCLIHARPPSPTHPLPLPASSRPNCRTARPFMSSVPYRRSTFSSPLQDISPQPKPRHPSFVFSTAPKLIVPASYLAPRVIAPLSFLPLPPKADETTQPLLQAPGF